MEILSVALFAFFSWWALSVGVKTSNVVASFWTAVVINAFVILLLILAGASLVAGV